uniref:Uncharacterized protein n=1 Tax=Opuntia streptacantha TaxID=393608 RepID=A0A7C9DGP7_OPUST
MAWLSSSSTSSRSVLEAAGSPDTTWTSRRHPTLSPSPAMTRQLRRNCLYACGWSNRLTSDQTVDTGAGMRRTAAEQHWWGPTLWLWYLAAVAISLRGLRQEVASSLVSSSARDGSTSTAAIIGCDKAEVLSITVVVVVVVVVVRGWRCSMEGILAFFSKAYQIRWRSD